MLRLLHERLMERLNTSEKLFAEESTAPVLDLARARASTDQFYAHTRNDNAPTCFGGGLLEIAP